MNKAATLERAHSSGWWLQATVVISASLFVALCARVTVPLPFTPVPLTLQNFAVLLVGLVLGSRAGALALVLYLAEGAVGLPVFSSGAAGVVHLFGPTAGFLMAYPFVAFVAGWVAERGRKSFGRMAVGAILAEIVLFAGGVAWLAMLAHGSWWQAAHFGLYPFVFAEVAKMAAAAGLGARLPRLGASHEAH